ncbi:uncharacterized protein LOC126249073 [Schistocerca nitens]|uniref:uncharacterized protein LOC126249073 n=1 Tax=Schistocerca nitens TaxID=7011 RepID=UPI002117F261|nr:uncharacterized protein LOC126249073 [Schistocerca nitens]
MVAARVRNFLSKVIKYIKSVGYRSVPGIRPELNRRRARYSVRYSAPHKAQPLAFEVPVTTESLIRRHPPRRLKRLEDQQLPLTHQLLDEKQAEAEQRRHQILTQRVQSAQQRYPKRNFQGY